MKADWGDLWWKPDSTSSTWGHAAADDLYEENGKRWMRLRNIDSVVEILVYAYASREKSLDLTLEIQHPEVGPKARIRYPIELLPPEDFAVTDDIRDREIEWRFVRADR